MRACRLIARVLAVLALGVLIWDGVAWARTGAYDAVTGGRLWASVDLASLNLAQAVVQRYVLAELWDYVLLPILLWPLWLVLGVLGVLLLVLCRRRTPKPAEDQG